MRGPGVDDGRIGITLRIGVVGHRTLVDEPALALLVDGVVEDLLAAWGDRASTSTPFRLGVVSALAEGADRLVVHALMARGAALNAVLPLEPADFERDFSTEASVSEFRSLLERADLVSVMADGEDRPAAYLSAGQNLVRRADLIIAIWDGEKAAGVGGTASVVAYARTQRVPLAWIHADANRPTALDVGGQLVGWDAALPLDAEALAELDRFNEWPVAGDKARAVSTRLAKGALQHLSNPDPLEAAAVVTWVAPFFARAELAANHYERRHTLMLRALVAMSFGAVLTAASQESFWPRRPGVIWLEVLLLISAVVALSLARRRRLHNRWITARYLGEAFRSALFMCAAGIVSDRSGADPRLAADSADDRWLRRAFSEVWSVRPQRALTTAETEPLRRLIAEGWVEDQLAYHRCASREQGAMHKRLAAFAYVAFGVSVLAAVLHSLDVARAESESFALWGFLSVVVPALAAALAGLGAQRGYQQHADRYGRMVRRLTEAKERLARAHDLADLQQLALDIDNVIRDESSQWFGVARLHDLELPG